jgi:hypothetical protein
LLKVLNGCLGVLLRALKFELDSVHALLRSQPGLLTQ